ncbi:MAG: DUF1573 domain-containing protein [Niabella sp.]
MKGLKANNKYSTNDSLIDTEISIDKSIIDVGKVITNDTVKADFTIHNLDPSFLYIKEVLPDCKCTSSSYDQGRLIPIDSNAKITLKYVPRDKGIFQVSAVVSLNSKTSPMLILRGEY